MKALGYSLAIMACVFAAVACGGGTAGEEPVASAPPLPPSQKELDKLRDLALERTASERGNTDLHDWKLFATTKSRARAFLGYGWSSYPADEPVYVITARGNVIGYDVPRPPGTPPPRGDGLWLMLRPDESHALAAGIPKPFPELSDLGQSMPLE